MENDLQRIIDEAVKKDFNPKFAIQAALKLLGEAVGSIRMMHRELESIRQHLRDGE